MNGKTDTSSHNAVVLAAGLQERFGDGKPKCLCRINNGETVIERLVRKLNMPTTIVLHDQWPEEFQEPLRHLGTLAYVPPNKHIGHSIAAGLRASCRRKPAVIVAADTYVPGHLPLAIPQSGCAIFDPWEWITIYCTMATQSAIDHFARFCKDRVSYLETGCLMAIIRRTGYININKPLDLLQARLIEEQ